MVYIGCSGWNYKHWRNGVFYPPRLPASRWLEFYAERFATVEVNATFYRLPRRSNVEHWMEQTPPGFLFTVKASRYLTHIKRLRGLRAGLKRFYARIAPLARSRKMGPVLWQLPENFHRDDERLAAALTALPRGRHAFEFRHKTWFDEDIHALLRKQGVALVIGDHPLRPFQSHELTADWTFVRFHYGRSKGNYSEAQLKQWARRIKRWARRGDVYAYFNNDFKGYAPRNALKLLELLKPSSPRPSTSLSRSLPCQRKCRTDPS